MNRGKAIRAGIGISVVVLLVLLAPIGLPQVHAEDSDSTQTFSPPVKNEFNYSFDDTIERKGPLENYENVILDNHIDYIEVYETVENEENNRLLDNLMDDWVVDSADNFISFRKPENNTYTFEVENAWLEDHETGEVLTETDNLQGKIDLMFTLVKNNLTDAVLNGSLDQFNENWYFRDKELTTEKKFIGVDGKEQSGDKILDQLSNELTSLPVEVIEGSFDDGSLTKDVGINLDKNGINLDKNGINLDKNDNFKGELKLNLKDKSASFKKAELVFGDFSISWSVSSQTNWEDATDSGLSENHGILSGSLTLSDWETLDNCSSGWSFEQSGVNYDSSDRSQDPLYLDGTAGTGESGDYANWYKNIDLTGVWMVKAEVWAGGNYDYSEAGLKVGGTELWYHYAGDGTYSRDNVSGDFAGTDGEQKFRVGILDWYLGNPTYGQKVKMYEVWSRPASGEWVSVWHQFSEEKSILNITQSIGNLGGGLQVKVQTSNDGSTVKDDSGWLDITSTGSVTKEFTDLTGEYVRVKYNMTAGSSPTVNDYEVSGTTANVAPTVENIYTNDPIDPETSYDYKVEVEDTDNLSDVDEVYLRLYDNSLAYDSADSERDHYSFKWTRSGGFSEVGPDSGDSHLNISSCSTFDDTKSLDNILFDITLNATANPNKDWNAWVKTVDNSDAQDNGEFANEFSVNTYISYSVTVGGGDSTINFSGAPGENVQETNGPTTVTIDTNVSYDVQCRLENADWKNDSGGAIAAENTYFENSTGGNGKGLTTSFQDVYTAQSYGEGVARDIDYWFYFPSGASGTYTNNFILEAVQN